MKTAIEILRAKALEPCFPARDWMADKSPEAAWAECQRPDWMIWALEAYDVAEADWRLLMRRFAQTALQYWEAPEVVRQWIDTGDEQYRSAAESAAWSATYSAVESAAWSAARSAAESAARSAARSAQCDIIRELFPWTRMAVLIGEVR